MLVVEPERRLSISQILVHPWMGSHTTIEPEPEGDNGCPPEIVTNPPLNQLVIETMLTLPGLNLDELLQAVQGSAFNHISAIYNLLCDQLENAVTSVPRIQNPPSGYVPDDAQQLEKV